MRCLRDGGAEDHSSWCFLLLFVRVLWNERLPMFSGLVMRAVDVGRGSHSAGRIYGDLGNSVCEDITVNRCDLSKKVVLSPEKDDSIPKHSMTHPAEVCALAKELFCGSKPRRAVYLAPWVHIGNAGLMRRGDG